MGFFPHLTKNLELFKAGAPSAMVSGGAGAGQSLERVRISPEEPWRRRELLPVRVHLIHVAMGFVQFCLLKYFILLLSKFEFLLYLRSVWVCS